MKFEGPPKLNPVENPEPQKPELKDQNLEANTIPVHQENADVSEADIIARKEAGAKKIAELREQLGPQPEIKNTETPTVKDPEVANKSVSKEATDVEIRESEYSLKAAIEIIRNFFNKRALIKERAETELKEMLWGDYDSDFWHFGASFAKSLPEEYKSKGSDDGFKLYIENILSQEGKSTQEEKNELTAVEFGGPGSRFFRGFSNGFFRKTVGVCLADIRGENLKTEDSKLNHDVVTGDILDVRSNEVLNKVREKLDANKTDLITSRMQGALNGMNITLLDNAVRQWYSLLNENGIMFIQYSYAHSADKREDNIATKCIEAIKEKYPQLDIQLGRGVMRLHKKHGAPEQLPKDVHFFV